MRRIDDKDVEIVVLRHQLEVLHQQKGRPRFQPQDKMLLPALTRDSLVWPGREDRMRYTVITGINADVVPTEGPGANADARRPSWLAWMLRPRHACL
jgi:hypothetical protein